jgi:REP element-mobilizing transposase RayT
MIVYKRRLPHAYVENNPVFITWRLKFTLPRSLINTLSERKAEFDAKIRSLSEDYQNMQRAQFNKKQFDIYDDVIGRDPNFPQLLNRSDLASVIMDALRYHDGNKYGLHAFCIMPNHVHTLFTPFTEMNSDRKHLAQITHSIKRYTAREINEVLEREGSLWARESYDHFVRNDEEFMRIAKYIANNPVKAGTVESWMQWKYTWVEEQLAALFS